MFSHPLFEKNNVLISKNNVIDASDEPQIDSGETVRLLFEKHDSPLNLSILKESPNAELSSFKIIERQTSELIVASMYF